MNFPLVSRLIAAVLIILALAFCVCFGVTYFLDTEQEATATRKGFLASLIAALALAGALIWNGRQASTKFFKKEALCTIGLGWIIASLIGSIPYLFIVPQLGISGAIFESTSGLTTTGASAMTNLEALPASLLFWRCLSQWIGGMGVVVFFVAILGFLGAGAKILYAHESSGSAAEFEDSRVQTMVKHLIYIYAGLSLLCAVSYKAAGMDWFDAICHTFTTVSTAGFSTRSGSIADFQNPAIEWVAIVFMILGGINFALILGVVRGQLFRLKRNTEFLAYLSILMIAFVVIVVMLVFDGDEPTFLHAIRPAAFQVVSITTTTGYATEDFAAWSTLPQVTLLVIMTIGACSGSTAGGIKVVRLVVAVRLCAQSVERSFRTRIVRSIKMNNMPLSSQAAHDALIYLALATIICLAAAPLASMFEPHLQINTNLSAVIACFFNIGPGLAEVGPSENYGFLQPYTKVFLSLLMIMGRVELYAVLALFLPSLWKRFD